MEIIKEIETTKNNNNKNNLKFQKITEPFITKKKRFLWGLLGEYEVVVQPEELLDKEPILLYMDENQRIRPYFNVETGRIIEPMTNNGQKKGYYNEIISKKRCILEYGGVEIPIYIQYEKEALPYPSEPTYDSRYLGQIFKGIQLNYEDLDKGEGSFWGSISMSQVKTILYFIGGIGAIFLGVAWVGKTFGIWDMIFPAKEIVEQIITNVSTNVTEGVVNIP